MTPLAARSEASDEFSLRGSAGLQPAGGLRDLFYPLDDLLVSGGDPRLALDRPYGCNVYGCGPGPAPDMLAFASSTASPISERAFARVDLARETLMRQAIGLGLAEALERRTEAMRGELRGHLALPEDVEVVFSPSGTDSQLHALALTRALLGDALTTIVVGSDQTGSGTIATAQGRHFNAMTASGAAVRKNSPIDGLAGESVAVPLFDGSHAELRPDHAEAVLTAVQASVARGCSVMLQIMDASKLGWRAPDRGCLDEIARRWPGRVQVVVDACQMRLSRRRLRDYLARGFMVLITGSKFFGGPAFSGALLVPGPLSGALAKAQPVVAPLFDYAARSDWPQAWTAWRAGSAVRTNFGQWLRWEAALAEIGAYYQVPDGERSRVVRELGGAIANLLARSPALCPIKAAVADDDDEFGYPTIHPFAIQRDGHLLPLDACQRLYRALRHDVGEAVQGSADDREIAARSCLIGQPVPIAPDTTAPSAVLRFCIGARQVIETWSADATLAQRDLDEEIGRIEKIAGKIELLVSKSVDLRNVGNAV